MSPSALVAFTLTVAASEPEPLTVMVAPISNVAAGVTDAAVGALRALPGLTAIDARGLRQTFGPGVLERYARCDDDACRIETLKVVPWSQLVVIDVGLEMARARLLVPGEPGSRVRVSRQIGPEGLEAAVRDVVFELFPVRAAATRMPVTVSGLPPGAELRVDGGRPAGVPEGGSSTLDLGPGRHVVEAEAPGHSGWRREFEVRVGEELSLAAELGKRRSTIPWVLAGTGLALGAGGAGLAVAAQIRADDWSAACSGRPSCAEGYTRERYVDDGGAQDVERAASIGLFVAGGAALVGAVIWLLVDPGGASEGVGLAAAPGGLGIRF